MSGESLEGEVTHQRSVPARSHQCILRLRGVDCPFDVHTSQSFPRIQRSFLGSIRIKNDQLKHEAAEFD